MKIIRNQGETVYKCKRCGLIETFNENNNNSYKNLENNLTYLYYEALDFFNQSNYNRAFELFNKIIDIDPFDEESWFYIGLIYLFEDKLEEAFFSFKSALNINPELIDAWNGIGIIYDKSSMFEEAIEAYTRAIDEDPDTIASEWLFYINNLIKNNMIQESSEELIDFIEFCNTFLLEDFYFEGIQFIEFIKNLEVIEKEKKKIKNSTISLKTSTVQEKDFKNELKTKGIFYLYYICDFENIPNIFQKGILSRNYIQKLNFEFKDISEPYAQKYRKKNMNNDYKKDIHDFACLFFTPHTKMLRNVCFSQYKDNEVGILQLDPGLMDKLELVYFTDKNCAKKDFSLYNKVEDLNKLNWDYLTKDYDFLLNKIKIEEKTNFEACRSAEILVYEKIYPNFIIPEIIVKSLEAKSVLFNVLNKNKLNQIRITIDEYKFPMRPGSNAYKNKMKQFKNFF